MALPSDMYTVELFAQWTSTTEYNWSMPKTVRSASNTACVSTQKRKRRIWTKARLQKSSDFSHNLLRELEMSSPLNYKIYECTLLLSMNYLQCLGLLLTDETPSTGIDVQRRFWHKDFQTCLILCHKHTNLLCKTSNQITHCQHICTAVSVAHSVSCVCLFKESHGARQQPTSMLFNPLPDWSIPRNSIPILWVGTVGKVHKKKREREKKKECRL